MISILAHFSERRGWVKECHVYHAPVITIFMGAIQGIQGIQGAVKVGGMFIESLLVTSRASLRMKCGFSDLGIRDFFMGFQIPSGKLT